MQHFCFCPHFSWAELKDLRLFLWPHNRRPHVTTQPRTSTSSIFTSKIVWDQPPAESSTTATTISLHNQIISAQTIRNRLREAYLHARHPHWGLDLTAVHRRKRLEWANAHIRWHLALWRGVLFTDLSRFSLYRADGRRRVWRCAGERFAVNVVDRVVHGGCGVMVWAGVCYGQRIQVHFIDGILNAQRYRDEVLRPVVVPFIHDNHLMLQHDNGDMSLIEHVWDALDWRIRQRGPFSANIQQLRTAIEEKWINIPQATINNLINSMRRRCVALHEANGGHTRYWLVFAPVGTPPPPPPIQ